MRVLMISLDQRMFGRESRSNDVVDRHQKYADLAGSLDAIVFGRADFGSRVWAPNFRVVPTNSTKFHHFRAAYQIAGKLVSEQKYDLLITQEFAAPVGKKIKLRFGTPWIITIHSMFFAKQWLRLDLSKWYLFYLIKRALRLADGFRVVNPAIKSQLLDWGVQKPILVEPTPVDIAKFKMQNTNVKITSKNPKVLFVGRLSAEKNVSLLLGVFEQLPADAELWIVGEGSEAKKLERLGGQNSRVKFLGQKSHDELVSIYSQADIFVLPSNTESFGWALLEAAAAGCAIVATKTPGAMSIIEDGKTGLLVEVGDAEELRKALGKLISSPDLRQRLGENARKLAEKYDSEKAIARIVTFWKEIASKQ